MVVGEREGWLWIRRRLEALLCGGFWVPPRPREKRLLHEEELATHVRQYGSGRTDERVLIVIVI